MCRNDIGLDPHVFEGAKNADMSPPSRRTGAERQTDFQRFTL
jgi:hypothetical protein